MFVTFVAHLYDALRTAGFHPFLDAKSLVKDPHASNSIDEALSGVRVHVAVFSKHYAESKYCLNELCQILTSGKVVLPVYYDVYPEHLARPYIGPFAAGFRKHMRLERHHDVRRWEKALLDVASIEGFRLHDFNGDEAQLKRRIVTSVSEVLDRDGLVLQTPQQFVGLQHANNLNVDPLLFQQSTAQNLIMLPSILGKGAFGHVYLGRLQPSNKTVAIKVLRRFGTKSFESEVCTLGSIHHVNLVRLLGYCVGGSKHVLVYEYMSNSSLDKWLFGDAPHQFLDWNAQVRIISGVAQGLTYLHHGCNPPILHLDIKPQNILLSEDYIPKLADFGLANFFDADGSVTRLSSHSTPGTYGYMAPEIFNIRKVTTKTDVYSFGVVLIELVRGKRNFNQHAESEEEGIRMFTKWAQMKMQQGHLKDIFKLLLNNSIPGFNPKEAKILMGIALMCIQEELNERPNMQQVVKMLAGLDEDSSTQFANFQQILKENLWEKGPMNQMYYLFWKFFNSEL